MEKLKAFRVVLIRAMPPLASTTPDLLKSSNQETVSGI